MAEILTAKEIATLERLIVTNNLSELLAFGYVPRLLADHKALFALLADAIDFGHAPGCSGEYTKADGSWAYGCKCGYREWIVKVDKILEEKSA